MQVEALQDLVHRTREARRKQTLPKYPPHERDTLIKKYHPDFRESAYRPIKFGPNTGDMTVRELACLLEGDSPIPADLDLTPAHSVDVLVIGGGGAGSSAALHAHARGAQVMLVSNDGEGRWVNGSMGRVTAIARRRGEPDELHVALTDGRKVDHFTKFPPGTKENPLDTEAMSAKVRDLMTPVLGADKTNKLIDQINNLERVDDVRALRALFTA